jgi:NADPH:quinone reductase-like Zn-dependent oxidoreductase
VKAIVYHRFGPPEVLKLQDLAPPDLTDDGVLVRVRASSVNPAEWYAVTGRPYIARTAGGLRRPKHPVPGADFAGTVEAVGSTVIGLRPGDAVFGGTTSGAFAEYVCVAGTVVAKPAQPELRAGGGRPHRGRHRPCRACATTSGSGQGTRCWSTAPRGGALGASPCSWPRRWGPR